MDTPLRPPAAWRLVRELRHAVLDCLLPPHCCACGERLLERIARGRLCRTCLVMLESLPERGCSRCGESTVPSLEHGDRCAGDHRDLVGLSFAAAAYRYRGTGGALVRRLKLQADFAALDALGIAMARCVTPWLHGRFRRPKLVSVPLHRARRRRRGFDQAHLLAEDVARRLGLDLVRDAMVRVRATVPQGDARVTSREQNVAGVFVVARRPQIEGQAVLLVDDVMTSGATARECAARLRAAGATRVALLTACRARGPAD